MTQTDGARCVKDMLAEAVERIRRIERDLGCDMRPAKFASFAEEADRIAALIALCKQRFVEKSQGA